MRCIFTSAIVASLLASTASAAYAEARFIFRHPTGAVAVAPVDREPEAPDAITFNFAPSTTCAGDSVSMTGLVQDGYSVSLESGRLPSGLALNGTSISGTASAAGLYDGISFRVTAPGGGSEVFGPYSMHISDLPKPTLTPQQILTSQNYSHSIAVSGGTGPYGFELVGGTLPDGLQLSPTGVLSSPPSGIETAGDFDPTIKVTDKNGCHSTDRLYVSVAASLADAELENYNPPFYAGEPVSFRIAPQGGIGPFDFKTVSSVPGLTVHEDGTVTGTPMAAGDYRLDVTITDSALFPQTRNAGFQIRVTNREVARSFSNNNGTPVTVQSLFTAEEWASATTEKIASVPSGVILGSSNPAQAALSIGSHWAGKLTLNVSGQIQGAGGMPGVNGGRGGDALTINATSTSGQDLIVNGSGRILAGGGAGGAGGKGGNGIVTNTVREPASGYFPYSEFARNYWFYSKGNISIFQDGRVVAYCFNDIRQCMQEEGVLSGENCTGCGNYVYRIGEMKSGGTSSSIHSYYRELVTNTATMGGLGGSGGAGQGYNQSAGIGANGAVGGTNAGTGGRGGNGGAFGQAGAGGSTGANGTSTSGTAGMAGGAAGTAIVNAAGARIIFMN